MSTMAQLDLDSVTVEAGERVALPLQVTNARDVVEDYRVQLRGIPAEWCSVEPEEFNLYPGTAQTVTVDVHPPRASWVPAGEARLGVLIEPLQRPDEPVVHEAVIDVLPFYDTMAELVPRTSHGRRGAKHQVAVDNRGNTPVTVELAGDPGSDAITATPSPKSVTVGPGEAAFCDLRVRPTELMWTGPARTLPFSLTVNPPESEPLPLDGTHLQDPVLPKWFFKALAGLLALVLLLAGLWALLLRPTIESAAKAAVEEPMKTAAAEASSAKEAAAQAQQGKTEAQAAAASAQTLVGQPPAPKTVTAPFSGRLEVTANPTETKTEQFKLEPGQSLSLTDLVLENTQGDSGLLTIKLGDKTTLLTQALESFRTTDYHFVTPVVFGDASVLSLNVTCNKPGAPPNATPPTTCHNAVSFGGQRTSPQP
ncbi:MAG: hypothetical protein WCG47_26595 [Dermatophilaceae bacterium]